MLIREAKPEEADDLTRLAVRSKRAWGYDDDFMGRVMPDMIVHREYLLTEHGIVAQEAGMPIGYAIVSVDADRAFLRDLFVEPDRFRQGIGAALFGEAVRFAREQGAESITLGGDPNAIGFYERMGMRQIGYEPSIVGNGRMLPIMTLDIT
jgi:GNAT superfamily N-acetyltransferase